MGVLFAILKIAGVIIALLLSIVGIILLLFLIALMIPIRYDVSFDKTGEMSYAVVIKYFVFSIGMTNDKAMYIKIFNKQLIPRKKMKRRTASRPSVSNPLEEGVMTHAAADVTVEATEQKQSSKIEAEPKEEEKPKKEKKPKEKKPKKEKSSSKFGIDFLQEYILKKSVLKAVCTLIIRIGKAVLPKKHKGWLLIGFEDPAMTGQILAVCGIAIGILPLNIKVEGDFEKQRLECGVRVVGHFSLMGIVFTLLRFALTKDIWKIVKYYLRKEDDDNGSS